MRSPLFSLGLCAIGGLIVILGLLAWRFFGVRRLNGALATRNAEVEAKRAALSDSCRAFSGCGPLHRQDRQLDLAREGPPGRSRAARGRRAARRSGSPAQGHAPPRRRARRASAGDGEEVAALKDREKRLLAENGQLKDSLSMAASALQLMHNRSPN
jgi:hypothetical protein